MTSWRRGEEGCKTNKSKTNPTKKNVKLEPCFERENGSKNQKSPTCQVKIKNSSMETRTDRMKKWK
jgi:hypothetical protein